MTRKPTIFGGSAVAALVLFSFWQVRSPGQPDPTQAAPAGAIVEVKLTPVSGNAAIGKQVFENACAACHGVNAAGTQGVAPPLIHKIYEPNHHADESFQRAAALGVKSHHWRFGDMPPVPGLTRGDVTMVIAYIRQLQRANGIH